MLNEHGNHHVLLAEDTSYTYTLFTERKLPFLEYSVLGTLGHGQ